MRALSIICMCILGGSVCAHGVDNWRLIHEDDMTGDWREHWLNDAEGTLATSDHGMRFRTDDGHDVVWFLPIVTGDVRIECDITNNGTSGNAQILFIHARGIGGDYPEDILTWRNRRNPADYVWYKSRMHNLGISMDNPQNEVRFRHNAGFSLIKTYANADILDAGVRYHIVAQKTGRDILFEVGDERDGTKKTFTARCNSSPPLESGRIGFRQMGGRDVTYRNFAVYSRESVPVRGSGLQLRPKRMARAVGIVCPGANAHVGPRVTFSLSGAHLPSAAAAGLHIAVGGRR
ncbi:MAG: hypothetical protein GF331_21065 [Chitinivibrionales bacterium]|nr:hypothetical protein [Chitinivibrionales bacterium]